MIDIHGVNSSHSAQLFQQIAQIKRMDRGKLTVMRQTPDGPCYKLQAWENGKNLSRYLARDRADAVQEALDGYRQFQELTGQYAQAVIDRTRAELAAHSKKKSCHRRRESSWPKTRKSGK